MMSATLTEGNTVGRPYLNGTRLRPSCTSDGTWLKVRSCLWLSCFLPNRSPLSVKPYDVESIHVLLVGVHLALHFRHRRRNATATTTNLRTPGTWRSREGCRASTGERRVPLHNREGQIFEPGLELRGPARLAGHVLDRMPLVGHDELSSGEGLLRIALYVCVSIDYVR